MKFWLVRLESTVYLNDKNFVVIADTKEEAETIVRNDSKYSGIKHLYTTELTLEPRKLEGADFKITRIPYPDGKGIIHDYDPHAGEEGEMIEYTCEKCGNVFHVHSHTGPRMNTRCPECSGKVHVTKRHVWGS